MGFNQRFPRVEREAYLLSFLKGRLCYKPFL
ncbi:MAG: hypothetical protein RLZZ408_678 [Verrucomicrobiota bacterium]